MVVAKLKQADLPLSQGRRALAERVMIERGMDPADTALRNSVVFKVVQALRHARWRRLVRMYEKREGMCVRGPRDAITLRAAANTLSTSD